MLKVTVYVWNRETSTYNVEKEGVASSKAEELTAFGVGVEIQRVAWWSSGDNAQLVVFVERKVTADGD